MKAVLTGAAGLIGSAALRALREAGHEVVPVLRRTHASAGSGLLIDLSDPGSRRELASIRPDVLVHCAAVLPSRDDEVAGRRAATANETIDAHVLGACIDSGARLVFISSASVYGDAQVPHAETTPPRPAGPYAAAKLATERSAAELLAGRAISLRVNAPYGPSQRHETVLRIFIENAIRGLPLRYHGSGSREQIFTSELDIASAIVCSVERADVSGCFNVAGADVIRMKALAELVIACMPETTSIVEASGQPDPQERRRVSIPIEASRRALGWSPREDLAGGIRRWAATRGRP